MLLVPFGRMAKRMTRTRQRWQRRLVAAAAALSLIFAYTLGAYAHFGTHAAHQDHQHAAHHDHQHVLPAADDDGAAVSAHDHAAPGGDASHNPGAVPCGDFVCHCVMAIFAPEQLPPPPAAPVQAGASPSGDVATVVITVERPPSSPLLA